MPFLKGIFNKAKPLDPQKTFDTISSGIDKLFYTNEEKAEASQKAWDQWLEWYKLTNDENSARSKSRRILAVMFTCVFLFLLLAAAVFYLINQDYSMFLFELCKSIFPLITGIMFFYFGYYGVKSIVQSNSKNKYLNIRKVS